nr:integrase, catalytic region, zinc finger, CCHC-type, peptidase aspartic, catalytic [Tanacetum cinerariifolium]
MVGGNGGNQFRQYAGKNAGNLAMYNNVIGNQIIQNAIRNGNLVATRAEGNAAGQNGNQIRCYNCRGVEEYDLMAAAADLDEIEEVDANCILMVNLQQASTLGTQTDSAPIYDTDGSAEVHENCDDNEIFNMCTQEEQYTELLKPIPESHQVSHNDVISEDTSVEQAKFVGDFKSLANEADASLAKHKALELEIERLLKAVVSHDIMIIVQNESVVDTLDLQTELEHTKKRFENCIIKKETEYAKLWNDPMRIASINEKRYVLVIVDDYSHYTWVHFLRSKDEAPEDSITYAPSTIKTQQTSESELDLLFEVMYDDYIGGQLSATGRIVSPAQESQVCQTSTASTTIADTVPTPTNSSSLATNIPITSHDVKELNSNAMIDGNTFVNPFASSSTSTAAASSSQNVDPSNMHTFYQPYPYEFQWTKDHPLEQVIGEPSRPVLTKNQL